MNLCFSVRIRACISYSGADQESDSMKAECLHSTHMESLWQLLWLSVYWGCFAAALEEGNIFLMKISKEFESFFLHNQITLCASMVEARKGGMMHLANREAARSGMWRQDQQKGFGRSALVLGASLVLLCFSLVRCPVVSAKLGKYKWTTAAAVAVEKEYLVVGKTCTERGSSWGLEGALSARGHRVLNYGCWGTPVGMGACEVMVKEGDYSEGLFCVVVVQDQGLVCWRKPFAEQTLSFIAEDLQFSGIYLCVEEGCG